MKKDIWSNVYYRLNDPAVIRLAVLYVLKYVDLPISQMDLKHVMLDATNVDYFDLCGAIDDLHRENFIKTVLRDEINKYILTEEGSDLINSLEKDVLYSVRQKIKSSSDKFFKSEFEKSLVRSSLTPTESETFYLDMELNEGKSKLFSLSIYAGSKENAMKMREKFTKNPTELFQVILKHLQSDSDSE